ncbi:MAG TPA: SgcJ/EcaC family oxidoreductase [Allosphingosinicella sp.]|nr:SgcJ/EcaC family oxidoreductase [Allosphingosinicella sp.]
MPESSIVDRQIEAFNARDAEAFASTYTEDAEIITALTPGAPVAGRAAIRDFYAPFFAAHPELNASVEGRLVVGNMVADQEHVTPLNLRALAVYEIEGDLIRRAWIFGPIET